MEDLDALLADLENTTREQQVNLRLSEASELNRPTSMNSYTSGKRLSSEPAASPGVELRRGPPPMAATATNHSYVSLRDNMDQLDTMLRDLDQPKFVEDMNRKSDFERPISDHDYAKVNKNVSRRNDAQNTARELDDLMSSLNDFKLSFDESDLGSELKSRNENDLDRMLGNLESDMSRRGVKVAAKGVCAACEQPIVGKVITALEKQWHYEHFICYNCRTELGSSNFFEDNGQPYCESCHQHLCSPICAYCNQPILDKCLTALEQQWHPEHFFCNSCSKPFEEGVGFHEKNGLPYCRECFYEAFAPRCGGCNEPIINNYITALNTHWHAACFACRECGIRFTGGQYFELDGQPYCEHHYHLKRGSICSACGQAVTGRCITALGRKWHPEHFVCTFCLKELNRGTFKERADKPYCHECFVKLFG